MHRQLLIRGALLTATAILPAAAGAQTAVAPTQTGAPEQGNAQAADPDQEVVVTGNRGQ